MTRVPVVVPHSEADFVEQPRAICLSREIRGARRYEQPDDAHSERERQRDRNASCEHAGARLSERCRSAYEGIALEDQLAVRQDVALDEDIALHGAQVWRAARTRVVDRGP